MIGKEVIEGVMRGTGISVFGAEAMGLLWVEMGCFTLAYTDVLLEVI